MHFNFLKYDQLKIHYFFFFIHIIVKILGNGIIKFLHILNLSTVALLDHNSQIQNLANSQVQL